MGRGVVRLELDHFPKISNRIVKLAQLLVGPPQLKGDRVNRAINVLGCLQIF